MTLSRLPRTLATGLALASLCTLPVPLQAQTAAPRPAMEWWREARFGMFIHWGLYAIPAGTWNGNTDHGEWIRSTARIPLEEYDRFVPRFNPTGFDAAAWVRMAKDAGMKYIVITSKHHDGFCLFDAPGTDFDIMATPFKRDIMQELADECRRQDMKMCWYYSIMDWHHPDYLPRREWEKDRSTAGADFDRYVAYMKEHLRTLITRYGDIGVLWFDGEWESTWNRKRGADLAAFVRSLDPDIIINNRVDGGRAGMQGFTQGGPSAGDFGTPEQEIPAQGLPGVDWETCMTMNDHWGYNSTDPDWKSSHDLLRMLADIASKGGNYLLNVGPRADGTFPPQSVQLLSDIGTWMRVNGESIYGTQASPFPALPFGRCTQKPMAGGTRLYLHIFDWPADRTLLLPGLLSPVRSASLLAAPGTTVTARATHEGVIVTLPASAPDPVNSVLALDIEGLPAVVTAPAITAASEIFVGTLPVSIDPPPAGVTVRYTTDGSAPTNTSPEATAPFTITSTTTVTARNFRKGAPVGVAAARTFRAVVPEPAIAATAPAPGIRYQVYHGSWTSLPDAGTLRPVKEGIATDISAAPAGRPEQYAIVFTGLLHIPATGVYSFALASDDGSRLHLGGRMVIDNDGLHSLGEKGAMVALAAGYHRIRVEYFQGEGGDGLILGCAPAGDTPRPVPPAMLFHEP